jgi:hypothetical protein
LLPALVRANTGTAVDALAAARQGLSEQLADPQQHGTNLFSRFEMRWAKS